MIPANQGDISWHLIMTIYHAVMALSHRLLHQAAALSRNEAATGIMP